MNPQECGHRAIAAAELMECRAQEILALVKKIPERPGVGSPDDDRVDILIATVIRVLHDEESQEGGWGPDVTMVGVLKEGLKAVGIDYDKLGFDKVKP